MNGRWQYDLIYKNGEYQQHSELQIPIDVLHTHDFLERMRKLNGFLWLSQWN